MKQTALAPREMRCAHRWRCRATIASLAAASLLACNTCRNDIAAPTTDAAVATAATDPPAVAAVPPQPGPSISDSPSPVADSSSVVGSAADVNECFGQPPSDQPLCFGLSNDEMIIFLAQDADGDGSSNLMEATNGTDPFDPLLGGDIDGDGILNRDDPDVDGDGEDNSEDSDIDGDGDNNGDDEDVDGDGLDDEDDTDDDGDGDDDCGCEHGTCSSFGGLCFCEAGWEGEDCDDFHCKDVRNCNNGTCVGPNTCRCNPGWNTVGSIPCVQFHCLGVNNCSGHGECIGANACRCEDDWKGKPDCSRHTCTVIPEYCDDGGPCTVGICGSTTGCHYVPECTSEEVCLAGDCFSKCNNRFDCPSGQMCRDGGCQEDCFVDRDCDDGDPCTTDICETSGDCRSPSPLKTCPNQGETCVRGRCVVACLLSGECEDDEKTCRDDGCFKECDEDDEDACGESETCDNGACVPQECVANDECTPPQKCLDGVCAPPF